MRWHWICALALVFAAGCEDAGSDADVDTDVDTDSDSDSDSDTDTDTGPWVPPQVYEDVPYMQEKADFPTGLPSQDVRALDKLADGTLVAGTAAGLATLQGDTFVAYEAAGFGGTVTGLAVNGDDLAVASGTAVHVFSGGAWTEVETGAEVSCVRQRDAGGWWVGTTGGFGVVEGPTYTTEATAPAEHVRDVAEINPLNADYWLFLATANGVARLGSDGNWSFARTADGLPSDDVRAITCIALPPSCSIGTAEGVVSTGDGKIWTDNDETEPYPDITSITTGDEWYEAWIIASTPMGAMRQGNGRWDYFHSRTWLPHDEVRDAAVGPDGTLYFATADGVSRIRAVDYTLEQKAAEFDALTQARHVRMDGFVTTHCALREEGDLTTAYNTDDDNDGQWTEHYLASQSFRYAVTGSAEAKDNARRSMENMLWLESVTEIPGFFARSVIEPDQCAGRQCEGCGEWHLNSDETWCWKGDTSGDEWVGHFFGLPLYHDLVADAEEQQRIRDTLSRILDRAIEHGYQLVDKDGLVTEHGYFDPEFIGGFGLLGDAGLYSAMMLGALKTGYALTGNATYLEHFEILVNDHGYAEHVRMVEEIMQRPPMGVNHDSEEMAFLALATLIRYETDPEMMAIWQEALDLVWQVQRPERNPEFNLIYTWLAQPDEYDLDNTVRSLREIKTNLVLWETHNSHRADITLDPKTDRFGEAQSITVLPFDERKVLRWSENPYRLDWGGNGHAESSGMFWLLPYWTGRYIGVITEAR